MPTLTDPLRVVRRRMAQSGLTGRGGSSPAEAVARLVVVQSQELWEGRWAVASRMRAGATNAEVAAALDAGEVLRTHVLRPTWHLVTPADLRWLLELSGPRVAWQNLRACLTFGMTEEMLEASVAAIGEALADGEPRTRRELVPVLERAGVDAVATRNLAHAVMEAELRLVAVSGPARGAQQTYVAFDARVPPAAPLPREEALGRLAHRYLLGHGPATDRDLAWWGGLTLTDARAALGTLGPDVASEPGPEGTTLWSARGTAPARVRASTGVHLLGQWDELVVAHRDLRVVRVTAMDQPELLYRPVLLDGVVVGSWKRVIARGAVTLRVALATVLDARGQAELGRAALRLERFLELPVALEVTQGHHRSR